MLLKFFFFSIFLLSPTAYSAVTKDQLLTFFNKNMNTNNLKTMEQDRLFSASKNQADVSHTIEAYGGPEKFKQVAAWCDQCKGESFTGEQIQTCNANLMAIYSHLTQDSKRSFEEDLKGTHLDKQTFLKGSPRFKLRLSSGRLKCDSQGSGRRLRIDFFSK